MNPLHLLTSVCRLLQRSWTYDQPLRARLRFAPFEPHVDGQPKGRWKVEVFNHQPIFSSFFAPSAYVKDVDISSFFSFLSCIFTISNPNTYHKRVIVQLIDFFIPIYASIQCCSVLFPCLQGHKHKYLWYDIAIQRVCKQGFTDISRPFLGMTLRTFTTKIQASSFKSHRHRATASHHAHACISEAD